MSRRFEDLDAATRAAIETWLTDPSHADSRVELAARVERARGGDMSALAELEDAFCGPLPIGTGGRRGACGPGPNRMNPTVLRETARGLVSAMLEQGDEPKVAIAYDTRRDSRPFADVVAQTLCDAGVEVLLVGDPRPTPELAYLVRAHGCGAGIVLSASHNPPGDNGIKIYGPDGAQVLAERDRALMRAIEAAMAGAPAQRFDRAGRIRVFETPEELASLDGPYLDFVVAQGVAADDLGPARLRVVFTPLHGVGHVSVVPALQRKGIDVSIVDEQLPDGGVFATVRSANPESPAALELAEAQARREGADLVLATDPDADRLGALARNGRGEFEFIDGNRLGVLMLDHVCRKGTLPQDGWVLTTLVTTPLTATIARAAGLEAIDDLLVGFKHHAGMMAEHPGRPVVFATEEAHGYVRGNDVHDKDGAVAALLLAEAAASAKAAGRTLFDELADVWKVHGYHREKTANIYAHGVAGRQAIAWLMQAWRAAPPSGFGGLEVQSFVDRAAGRQTGSPTRDLSGNVLVFELAAPSGRACRLVLRPSGTEPKLKVYALVRAAPLPAQVDSRAWEAHCASVDELVDRVLDDAHQRAQAVMSQQ